MQIKTLKQEGAEFEDKTGALEKKLAKARKVGVFLVCFTPSVLTYRANARMEGQKTSCCSIAKAESIGA